MLPVTSFPVLISSLVAIAMAGDLRAVDFAGEVAPVLEAKCLACHNPNVSKGEVSMDRREAILAAGRSILVPGDHGASLLHGVTVRHAGESRPEMPEKGEPLTAGEVGLIAEWIDSGAPWPDGLVLKEESKADRSWWAYQPLAVPALGTIDAYIDEELTAEGLTRNPPADRRSLIRRATYDLTGLPPDPGEVEAFVADPDPLAYERLVDRLLASPRYGERWGRHWLDVVRFGESRGFERNVLINNAWPFRDYVIKSLNEDKPFDVLIREHLAGDVVGKGDPWTEIGSAFLVAGPYDDVGNQDAAAAAQIRADTLDELIRSTGEAFLGMTIGCARCHDHKFDPIAQADYYGLYATFAGVRHGDRVLATPEELANDRRQRAPIEKEIGELEAEKKGAKELEVAAIDRALAAAKKRLKALPKLPEVWVGTRNAGEARGPFHTFIGGSPQRPGDVVNASSVSTLDEVVPAYSMAEDSDEGDRRLALAEWVTGAANPLTPRVLANRVWHYHFGTGIVDTPNDFGYMGGEPSHPRLLDFLAVQLQEGGWKLKGLHRTIMLSKTYRQSAAWRADGGAGDADGRLLWRFPPRRLSAEEIRDTVLSVAGELDLKMGGSGFRLYHFSQDNVCTYEPLDVHGPETYRRAIYHQNARASVVDLMTDFDQADCTFSVARRVETTTPLQALTLLNHSFTLAMAEALAERIEIQTGDRIDAQVTYAFQLAYQRPPDSDEARESLKAIRAHGLAAFARALLNSSELIYLD